VGVVSHEVITPSIGVHVPVDVRVPVDVGVVELSINVAAVNVSSVHVAPVDIPCVHVAPVDVASIDVASIDVTGRSISDRRPRTSSTASRDAGLRHCQPHAARNQNCENYNDPAHVSFSFSKGLFLPIYSSLRLQSVAWLPRRDIRKFLEKTLLQARISPNGHKLSGSAAEHFEENGEEESKDCSQIQHTIPLRSKKHLHIMVEDHNRCRRPH
jgi:hypothetical protein